MLDVGMQDDDQAVDLLAVDQLWDSGPQTNDDSVTTEFYTK